MPVHESGFRSSFNRRRGRRGRQHRPWRPLSPPQRIASGCRNHVATRSSPAVPNASSRVRSIGSDGLSIEKAFTVRIANVNERPAVAIPPALAAVAGVRRLIPGVRVADRDNPLLTVLVHVSHGTLGLGANSAYLLPADGGRTLFLFGASSTVNAALARESEGAASARGLLAFLVPRAREQGRVNVSVSRETHLDDALSPLAPARSAIL